MSNGFSTKDAITLILAIIGAVGTFTNYFFSYLAKRKNLKITVARIALKIPINTLVVSLCFENKSQLPISITSISFLVDEIETMPCKYPELVEEHYVERKGVLVNSKFLYNLNLPLDIQQLGAASGHILLDISQEKLQNLSTPLIVQVHSTRGKVQKITLPLDQIEYFQ